MSKFNVGDLITDKSGLYQVFAVYEDTYILKNLLGARQGLLDSAKKDLADRICVVYDLSKPLTKMVYKGACRCSHCDAKLYIGDDCVRYAGDVYCDEDCLLEAIAEDGTIDENDLDDSRKIEKPLFELTVGQLKLIEREHEPRNSNP